MSEIYIREDHMNKLNQVTCLIGLYVLKIKINNQMIFNYWVNHGLREIFVWDPIFGTGVGFWSGLWQKVCHISSKYSRSDKDYQEHNTVHGEEEKQILKNGLEILRNALNNHKTFDLLCKIGARGFSMPWPCDVKYDENRGPLIQNHVGCYYPNSDYSIKPDGAIWYHS